MGTSGRVVHAYARQGITSLYRWQEEYLSLDGVLSDRRSLVYTGRHIAAAKLTAQLRYLLAKPCMLFVKHESDSMQW